MGKYVWSTNFWLSSGKSSLLEKTALVYIASVIGGSLFVSISTPTIQTVGASAALFGLQFAYLASIVLVSYFVIYKIGHVSNCHSLRH